MSHSETGLTAIASLWEGERCESESNSKTISELVSVELGAIEPIWSDRKPGTGFGSTLKLTSSQRVCFLERIE